MGRTYKFALVLVATAAAVALVADLLSACAAVSYTAQQAPSGPQENAFGQSRGAEEVCQRPHAMQIAQQPSAVREPRSVLPDIEAKINALESKAAGEIRRS